MLLVIPSPFPCSTIISPGTYELTWDAASCAFIYEDADFSFACRPPISIPGGKWSVFLSRKSPPSAIIVSPAFARGCDDPYEFYNESGNCHCIIQES
ncbi:MAG: hypothetical protein WBC44_03785 [Planctomycetaceae bacterium]